MFWRYCDVKISGEFSKAFGEPLVVIALPADAMSPPLMGALMAAKEIRDRR